MQSQQAGDSPQAGDIRCSWVVILTVSANAMQGGIDGGGHENPMTAAVRELKEETGISSARIVALVWSPLFSRLLICLSKQKSSAMLQVHVPAQKRIVFA